MYLSIFKSSDTCYMFETEFMYECIVNVLCSRLTLLCWFPDTNQYNKYTIPECIQQNIITTPEQLAEYIFMNSIKNYSKFLNNKHKLYECLLHTCYYYISTRSITQTKPISVGIKFKLREYLVTGFLEPFKQSINLLREYDINQYILFCDNVTSKIISKMLQSTAYTES
jgi:hypothetical protein